MTLARGFIYTYLDPTSARLRWVAFIEPRLPQTKLPRFAYYCSSGFAHRPGIPYLVLVDGHPTAVEGTGEEILRLTPC